ncbi:LysE family translocator [Allosediminivita pacifica]|uniref:Threonine/homoserine/homoserine lactone efflux protein n=1 Tax=Allosediminivita pacifica TaxID=1267769 RepID=A0A2T6A6H2_9RHOB|nr:LysE family translocator [Allosediminivita pacifica]PTX39430.1 threonine/homoserine/homoserine lactone efflux protein [Allosediminivita pacifica]GGB27713.1 amino acid transporter LysE [Allosediminivita pacifica]
MTPDLFFGLAAFALATTCTPGPNNVMLMASGANFGFRRTLPHMLGIALGFPAMILLVGLGVMRLFEAWPLLRTILLALSVLYLGWLAWKVARAAPPGEAKATGTPLSFLQAAAFQWVNPKAWTMGLGAITLYAASRDLTSVLWVAGTYIAASVISTSAWTVAGQQLRRLLTNGTRLRVFNYTMATLLLASLLPALLG